MTSGTNDDQNVSIIRQMRSRGMLNAEIADRIGLSVSQFRRYEVALNAALLAMQLAPLPKARRGAPVQCPIRLTAVV